MDEEDLGAWFKHGVWAQVRDSGKKWETFVLRKCHLLMETTLGTAGKADVTAFPGGLG